MDQESKALSVLGPFGIIALCVLIFISLTCCLCFIIHVRFIWTVLCPLHSLLKCCSRCLNKFRLKHRTKPQNFSDLEKRILGSKSALKVARKTSQSCQLKDFHSISPRIKDFIVDIEAQNRQVIYKKSSGQVSIPGLKDPKDTGIRQTFGLAETHFVEIHQSQIKDSSIRNSRQRESLVFRERNTQTECQLDEIRPARSRANSTGEFDRQPLPRTTLVKKVDRSSSAY